MSTRSLNKVLLIGNLTRDPELKYTPQGTAVCTFGLATNREWTDSSGQKQEGAEFHRVVAWGKLAEICSQLLQKGRKIYIEGRLQTRSWKTPEGQDRQMTEVVMEEMIALDVPKGVSNNGESYENSYVPEDVSGGTSMVTPEEEVFTANTEEKPAKASKVSSKDVSDEIPF
ncbi:MAG TPA: single-stranded DNA-binding protein [Patescibacteria group bacterium]